MKLLHIYFLQISWDGCQFCEKDQNSRESCGPWLSRFKPKWPYLTKFISPTNFSALSVCLLLKGWVGGHPDGHLRELMLIVTRFYAEMSFTSPLLYKVVFVNQDFLETVKSLFVKAFQEKVFLNFSISQYLNILVSDHSLIFFSDHTH